MIERPRSLNHLFVLVLSAALVLLLSGVWALAQWRLGAGLNELRDSRFRFSLSTVRSGLEDGMRLGFNPADIPGAQALIDKALEREQDILSIDVFDRSGRILFTTDQGGLGAKVNAAWRDGCLAAPTGEVWRSSDDNDALQCSVAFNSLEDPSAGVMLRYQLRERAGIGGLLADHWVALLGLLGGCLLLGGMAGWAVIRPVERRVLADATALAGRGQAVDNALTGPVGAALDRITDIERDLQEIESTATRLDQIDSH
jgi:hypothetical protein